MQLYVFPLSHFCEKGRWALDHKGVGYRLVPLLPGPHLFQVRRFASGTTVPVIIDGETTVQGSDRIIDHLDARIAGRPLTPTDPEARREALDWEARLDREVGVTARRIIYFHGLPRADFVVPMFTSGGPSWGPAFYRAGGYAFVRRAIQRKYRVDADNVARDLERLQRTLDEVEARLDGRRYLVGGEFSRADLTLASLTAPFFRPVEHPFSFPGRESFPDELLEVADDLERRPIASIVRRLYRDHRRGDAPAGTQAA